MRGAKVDELVESVRIRGVDDGGGGLQQFDCFGDMIADCKVVYSVFDVLRDCEVRS